ncbi:ETX/MTX2 family pore-forming toxin [Spiroplasma endosymbiont of Nephrotoma flavescens]|uniref:ETX/MTX2 family pore-forming toxin n=1 Tax=Spiroplasma endosymbiont of Nephrotoma flavescens TaxID=3066302 RepID=UPI00313F2EAF
MKKLLGILGTITIASSGMAGIVGNAPTSEKSEINYLKINNSEKLNRSKRADWYGWYYINFYGISDILKGNFGLNTTNKKIIFGGFNDYRVVHSNTVNEVYNKITIKDNNGNLIKEILYWKDKSIQTKLEEENLLNGITYQDNYTIEIWSNEPWRTKFNNGNDIWKSFAENTLYFKIKNNRIYKLDDIEETIKKTQLEALDNNDASTIKSAVKKFNYNLDINEVRVSNITVTSADINGFTAYSDSYNSDKYRGYKRVYFTVKPDLITDFKTCLNPVNDTSDETILKAVKANNPNLDISQVYIKQKIVNGRLELGVKSTSNKYNTNNAFHCDNFKVRTDLSKIINNINLVLINNGNNNYIAILNELNYLNFNLDISQLEIKEKSNVSATIRAKINSDKYFGEKKIYYQINNSQNKIINLKELIKKAIFLSFRDKNKENIVKDIKNINLDNLVYSNVTATKNIEPTYNKNSKSICFGTTTLFNNLPAEQNMKTPSCKYTKETTINSQITTGLSKKSETETSTETGSVLLNSHSSNFDSETINSNSFSSSKSWEASGNAGFGLFGFSIGVSGGGGGGASSTSETSFSNTKSSTTEQSSSQTNTNSNTKTLSNTFDFSGSKTDEYKDILEVELPSQEIKVNPNQKIKVTASLDEVLAQVTLKLTQNIYGEITSQITNTSNEEKSFKISIKEIMQKLQQYNLLPQEVTINIDDSITFNGSANRSLKQGLDANIEFHEVK